MSQGAALHEPAAGEQPAAPSRFSGWLAVGKGGSSDVYKVQDTELGVTLAIKLLKQDHSKDRRYIESLRREVLISRKLRHPNICPIHDLYEGDRGVGIVMDFIEGQDLKQWLQDNRGHLLETMPSRLALLKKLCEALVVAHSLIIHRDLKPANIFLVRGDIGNPVIMDFGLSTPDDQETVLEGGTPKYMAPEQFLRAGTIDQRADLFALGILAYELLSDGQIPACSLKDAYKTGNLPVFEPRDIVAPSAFCAAIPPELDRLILQLVEHDPTKRPASAAEALEVLRTVKLLDPFRPLSRSSAQSVRATIPAGSYQVGDKSSGRSCDQPQRKIRLNSFSIACSPVTNMEYRRFTAATGYRAPALLDHPVFGGDLHPVVMVSWNDAEAYARWSGGRLPTELEWEVAAKACHADNHFPWGMDAPQITQANIDNICPTTTPIGSYRAGVNSMGLSDCCGNVWEWCADAWDEALLKSPAADALSPRSLSENDMRAIRGGSFDSPTLTGRASYRHREHDGAVRADIGFRIAFDC
jgi:formylglycine-generating enzyme required for sulfatase activity/predicted Ser/Thr protein kinase